MRLPSSARPAERSEAPEPLIVNYPSYIRQGEYLTCEEGFDPDMGYRFSMYATCLPVVGSESRLSIEPGISRGRVRRLQRRAGSAFRAGLCVGTA